MSTPAEYFRSLPPVSKFYGVTCLLTTTAYYLQLYHPWYIALSYEDVIKRFQLNLHRANHGVSLERGPFDKRTADFVWMLIFGAFSLLVSSGCGSSSVDSFHGTFLGVLSSLGNTSTGFDFWASNTARDSWCFSHKIVAFWGVGTQINSPVQRDPYAGVAFRGRGYRLNGDRSTNTEQQQQPQTDSTTPQQPNEAGGVAFRGRSHRLDADN
ncbi:hypothetical protein EZV62_005527 [Acer yangbiense]|uniref:Uncharacterized protein n=1 Tax=Acer yangbiense TaxID=1000413 RepID=A0A5C7IQD0_9ROSI|nr:hypothetical protein EZV62_005527 [Acer yangbiense]